MIYISYFSFVGMCKASICFKDNVICNGICWRWGGGGGGGLKTEVCLNYMKILSSLCFNAEVSGFLWKCETSGNNQKNN